MNTEIQTSRTLDMVAAEINQIKDTTRKMVLNNSIEIGKRLCEAKLMVEHGEWGHWLDDSVDYSQDTASNLMKIYTEYGAAQGELWGASAKSETFSKLSYSKALVLLAVPAADREAFAEEVKAEDLSTRELAEAIKAKKEAEEQTASYKMANEELTKDRDRYLKQKEDETKKYEEAQKEITKLSKKLDKLKKSAPSEESTRQIEELTTKINTLESEAENKAAEIERLKTDLAKPSDPKAIPEETQKELDALKAQVEKLSKASPDVKVYQFKVWWEAINENFNRLLDCLFLIKDETQRQKFTGAIEQLCTKMTAAAKDNPNQ